MRTSLPLILLLALVPACAEAQRPGEDPEVAEAAHVRSLMADPVARAAGDRVTVLASGDPARPIEALGVVDVHEQGEGRDRALAELRTVAAERGAEAIMGVEFHHGEGGNAPTHLSGLAVRFRNLQRDEPYDVLAHLDVASDMEHEDEALAALQHRAYELHADLVIGIAYEHGEGEGQPAHLTGTAIRYRRPAQASATR